MKVMENYKEVSLTFKDIILKGNLRLADTSKGIVIFSHGSGSSRMSSRNIYVAGLLLKKGFSSLLFDLLTVEEDMVYDNRFDIELLTQRLVAATKWVQNYDDTKFLPIGYFGASTGAASALCAASILSNSVKAVVSRGGRPDLAFPVLDRVKCPTLLLVGSKDDVVIQLNHKAKLAIKSTCELQIISGATHLFPEPGKLEEVANHTIDWFDKYLIN